MPVLGCGAEMAKLMDVANDDVATIEEVIAERLALGVSQAQAQRQAVDEALAQLAAERSMVMKAVQEQLAPKAPQFNEDIPNESWLQGKVDYAQRSPRNQYGVPKMQSVTGYFDNRVLFPARWAAELKGQRGEQDNVRKDDLAAIRKILKDTGKMPLTDNGKEYVPYIEIGYDGKPWVSEGNHRIMAAVAEGWDYIPAEVRYFDGGQRRAGKWSPDNLIEITERETGVAPVFSNKAQTDTPEFKRWFGESVVTDADGNPRVMYHGTAKDFSIFDRLASTKFRRASMDTVGSWFSSEPSKAEQYAGGEGQNSMPVYLSIKNPKLYRTFDDFLRDMHEAAGRKFEDQNPKGIGSTEELRAKLKAEGYDGIQFEQTYNGPLYQDMIDMQDAIKRARDEEFSVKRAERAPYTMKRERLEAALNSMNDELKKSGGSTEFDGHDVFVAFDPEQIKSAIGNNGQFDPANPDIRFSNKSTIGFYSALSDEVGKINAKAQPADGWKAQIKGLIAKGAVKADEVEWTGLNDWLDMQKGKVTKEQVQSYLDSNGVQVEEVTLGDGKRPSLEWNDFSEPDEYGDSYSDATTGHRIVSDSEGRFTVYDPDGEIVRDGVEGLQRAKDFAAEDEYGEGDRDNAVTKYSQYTLPGGENYREVLLTLPVKSEGSGAKVVFRADDAVEDFLTDMDAEGFGDLNYGRNDANEVEFDGPIPAGVMELIERNRGAVVAGQETAGKVYASSHWTQPNVLAHIRLNDRTDADGKRVLFVEEIQSDWGQEGKKKGFDGGSSEKFKLQSRANELKDRVKVLADRYSELSTDERAEYNNSLHELGVAEQKLQGLGVPTAPFVTKTEGWLNLALKRIMVMAAEGGYDRVAFVNGEQSANRYDLSKQVDSITYRMDEPSQTYIVHVYGKNGNMVMNGQQYFKPDMLEETFGKGIADKMTNFEGEKVELPKGTKYELYKLSGLDLKVGGEGMKTFYDSIVPKATNELLRKLKTGAKLGEMVIKVPGRPFPKNRITQPGFDVTDAMRERVDAGMPLFANKAQTETPEFKRWFGDSQVVDAWGAPLEVYHGMPEEMEGGEFRLSKYGTLGEGIYFTDDPTAAGNFATGKRYPGAEEKQQGSVVPAYLRMEQPFDDNFFVGNKAWQEWAASFLLGGEDPSAPWWTYSAATRFQVGTREESQKIIKALYDKLMAGEATVADLVLVNGTSETPWGKKIIPAIKAHGAFDGFILKNSAKGFNEYVVFKPEQVKSSIGNNGQFDPTNPDIRFANRAKRNDQGAIFDRDVTGRLKLAAPRQIGQLLPAEAALRLLDRMQLIMPSEELRNELRKMKIDVQHSLDTAVELIAEVNKLSLAEREMISDIIEKEMRTGVVPPQHAVRTADMMNQAMGRQTDELVRLGMLSQEAADRWRDKYLPRYYESKLPNAISDTWASFVGKLSGQVKPLQGIKGKHLKGRGMTNTIPVSELAKWQAQGWEIRDKGYDPATSQEVQVWRDFTKAEREKMGEIRDAGFRFVLGYMQTQRDIALGRMYERLASNPQFSSATEKQDWLQVPTGTIPGTGALRYGKLAGRYVPKEVLMQLQTEREMDSEAFKMYQKALSWWKSNKTVMNPVGHVNNFVSNITMAHMAGVSYWDQGKYAAAIRDFATGAQGIKDARDAGLFIGGLTDAELQNLMPAELRSMLGRTDGNGTKALKVADAILTFGLRNKMSQAYEFGDKFFKYLIYQDAIKNGATTEEAVNHAQRYIFTYDDLPRGARFVRNFIPFFAYTYKAIPALAHTAAAYPWRMAAPATIIGVANAMGYALAAAGDDDDWWDALKKYVTDPEFRKAASALEDEEYKKLPEWMKGRSALGTKKQIRLWTDSTYNKPVFLDVSRFIPGGDLFDINANAGGIPWLQPLMPSNPLLSLYSVMVDNKDPFFGKELVNKNTDSSWEAAGKRADYLWKLATPGIAMGNVTWDKMMGMAANIYGDELPYVPDVIGGGNTGVGKDGMAIQPKYAIPQMLGVKARPIDLEMSDKMDRTTKQKTLKDLENQLRQARFAHNKIDPLTGKPILSDRLYEKRAETLREKMRNVRQGLTVEGDAKD